MKKNTMWIQDGPRKVLIDKGIWNQCRAYMAEKDKLWTEFIVVPDDSPQWDTFNNRRNVISDRYRAFGIFATLEYRLLLENNIRPLLEQMAGVKRCRICDSIIMFTGDRTCALCGDTV